MLQPITSSIKPVLSVTDESFDTGHVHRYRLLMHITEESISMLVLNQSSNKFILLNEYQHRKGETVQKLEELFSTSPFLDAKYKSVTVSVATTKTTLVPSPFYNSNDCRKMLALNQSLTAKDIVSANYVRAYDLYNVFAIPEDLNNLLKSTFGTFSLVHSATPFMEGVHLEYRNLALPALFVDVSEKSFEVIATNGKQLLLYNSFQYQTPEDFIYYLLFVAEQLHINPELNPVMLSGNVQKESPVYTLLYQYFRHVNFADRPDQYKYHYEFEKLPSHAYFSLYSLALCE